MWDLGGFSADSGGGFNWDLKKPAGSGLVAWQLPGPKDLGFGKAP